MPLILMGIWNSFNGIDQKVWFSRLNCFRITNEEEMNAYLTVVYPSVTLTSYLPLFFPPLFAILYLLLPHFTFYSLPVLTFICSG